MTSIRIGGVPEHFNLPWHQAIAEGLFEQEGIDLQWTDYPGGTGVMCKDLRDGTLDMAVLLTEGMVADIAKGNPSKIIQWYVDTPLLWGIHVAAKSAFKSISELQGRKYAISRLGSGSHLMSFVDASQRGWQLEAQQFVLAGDLKGAIAALESGDADIFLWEKFMTKPYVDNGILRRVGVCPTPWPCFVLAATEASLAAHPELLSKIASIAQGFEARMRRPEAVPAIAKKYGLLEGDVREWMLATAWSESGVVFRKDLVYVVDTLLALNIIPGTIAPEKLISRLTDFRG